MAYATTAEVLANLPGLPQVTASSGFSACTVMIAAQGDDAMAFINGYCARRYALPFGGGTATGVSPVGDVPPLIRSIAKDLTAYRVYRAYYARDNVNTNDWTDKLKADAEAQLEKIRDGLADLFDTAGSLISETTGSQNKLASNTEDYAPSFEQDSPTSWAVDSDKLQQISDDRL